MNRCPTKRVPVNQLNQHLTCALCSGYFIDATTIVECLHSFCRACLLSYFETTNKCPICDIEINQFQLDRSIRFDRTLQMLVYKLIPGLYKSEFQRRKEFCMKHCDESDADDNGSSPKSAVITASKLFSGLFFDSGLIELASRVFAPDDTIVFSLESTPLPPPAPLLSTGAMVTVDPSTTAKLEDGTKKKIFSAKNGKVNCDIQKQMSLKRYFRCPAAVKVIQLKKLLANKFDSTFVSALQVDIIYNGNLLPDEWALMDVATVYAWDRKSALKLHFTLYKLEIEEEPMPKLEIQVDETPKPSSSIQLFDAPTVAVAPTTVDPKLERVPSAVPLATGPSPPSATPNFNIIRLLSVDKLIGGKESGRKKDPIAEFTVIPSTNQKRDEIGAALDPSNRKRDDIVVAPPPIKNAPVNESILDDVIRAAMMSATVEKMIIKKSDTPSPLSLFDKQAMLLNAKNNGLTVKNSKKSLTSVVEKLSTPKVKKRKLSSSTDDQARKSTKKDYQQPIIADPTVPDNNNNLNFLPATKKLSSPLPPLNNNSHFYPRLIEPQKSPDDCKIKIENQSSTITSEKSSPFLTAVTSNGKIRAAGESEVNLINVVDLVAEGKEIYQQQQSQQSQSQQYKNNNNNSGLLYCV
uniref:RING-type domain-containing protein n=1 Tax=Romanomermis culicivorax TaxID=13658 RepID=A0A915KCX5_ROMCU